MQNIHEDDCHSPSACRQDIPESQPKATFTWGDQNLLGVRCRNNFAWGGIIFAWAGIVFALGFLKNGILVKSCLKWAKFACGLLKKAHRSGNC